MRHPVTSWPHDSQKPQIFTDPRITTHGDVCYWDYIDVCVFLICVVALGALLRLAIAYRLFPALALQQPTLLLQTAALVLVLLAFYATLKLRHGGAVWRALSWTRPRARYLLAGPVAGVLMAAVVTLLVQSQSVLAPSITIWKLAVLAAALGPILEESFFRGFLLPLIARTSGSPCAVILTALFFAFFHQPPTVLHCACFAVSGILYGWLRVVSGSTAAAALMHAVYNLALFACQKL